LDEFDAFSRTDEFYHRSGRASHDIIEAKIRKELYCFSSLAHSLQDHCRRVKSEWLPAEFSVQLENYFGTDGLHDFVCGLRTAMHHRSMAEADWSLRGSGPEMTSHYVLHRKELLTIERAWNERALRSIETMVDEIDVKVPSTEYRQRVANFYCWFFERVQQDMPPLVSDYRRCWNEHEIRSSRMNWSALLHIILEQKVDPYKHLPKYLTPPELDQAMSFVMRSREQVDFIISVVDERGACTDEIRAGVYRLFGVTPIP